MTITINGTERKMNIGCRTFVSVTQLLELLDIKPAPLPAITLNGQKVRAGELAQTMVKTGDALRISP